MNQQGQRLTNFFYSSRAPVFKVDAVANPPDHESFNFASRAWPLCHAFRSLWGRFKTPAEIVYLKLDRDLFG